jgi:hypothetical protein
MAKRSRNKQAARERIARRRAEQARRRRRRIRLASGAAATTVIGVAAAIVLAVTGGSGAAGGATSGLSLAPLSTLGALHPAPAPGVTGPEGVPVPAAARSGWHRRGGDRAARRPDQLPDRRADPVPHPRPPGHLRQRQGTADTGGHRHPGRAGPANPERPVHRHRQPLLLAAHPRRRRHHPHRVPGPADLHPRRLLRRVGAAAEAGAGRPGHRAGGGPIQRQGLPGQPARHSPHRARADPAGDRHPADRPAASDLLRRAVTSSRHAHARRRPRPAAER